MGQKCRVEMVRTQKKEGFEVPWSWASDGELARKGCGEMGQWHVRLPEEPWWIEPQE